MKKKKRISLKKILFINFYHWKINENHWEKKVEKPQVKSIYFESAWILSLVTGAIAIEWSKDTHNSASVTQIVGQKPMQ